METKWFRDRIRQQGLTDAQFGQQIGVNPWTISRRLSGERPFHPKEFKRIAEVLDVEMDEVMRRAGVPMADDPTKKVTIVGTVDHATGLIDPSRRPHYKAQRPAGLPGDGVALQVHAGDGGMSDWLIYYVPSAGVEPEAVGRLSVIRTGGRSYLAVLRRGRDRDRGRWAIQRLCADGPAPGMENVAVDSATPVLWIRT